MEIVTLAERPELEDAIWGLSSVWPRFMHQDPVADLYYGNLDRWLDHSLVALFDGEVVADAFVSVHVDLDQDLALCAEPNVWVRHRW